jgi:hypothetical protein
LPRLHNNLSEFALHRRPQPSALWKTCFTRVPS